jgi:chromosomal replication initiation ATPase DnaA
MTEGLLNNSKNDALPIPLVSEIKAAVVAHYKLTPSDMTSPNRARRVSHPRQVAMYLTRELTTNSYPKIGRLFGGRDHTTALYAKRIVTRRAGADSTLELTIAKLTRELLELAEQRLRMERPVIGSLVVQRPTPKRLAEARY